MPQQRVYLTPQGYADRPDTTATEGQITPFPNPKVEGYHEAIPRQPYPVGSLLPSEQFPQNEKPPKLFEELTIRGVTFPNRAWVSPMCQCKLSIHHPSLLVSGSSGNRVGAKGGCVCMRTLRNAVLGRMFFFRAWTFTLYFILLFIFFLYL